jgi:ribosomal protein S18 acetylase RimI-like enzyme
MKWTFILLLHFLATFGFHMRGYHRIHQMLQAVRFRNAKQDDLRSIAELCVDVFEGPHEWYGQLKKQFQILNFKQLLEDRFLNYIQAGKHSMIVACDDVDESSSQKPNKVVGFLEIGILPSPILDQSAQKEVLYIGNVAVDQAYRRKQIASKLLQVAIKFAEKCREPALYVAVEKENLNAFRLYEKAGFEILPRIDTDRYYLRRNISFVDIEVES